MNTTYRIVEQGQAVVCDYDGLAYAANRLTDGFASRGAGARLYRVDWVPHRREFDYTCLAETLACRPLTR